MNDITENGEIRDVDEKFDLASSFLRNATVSAILKHNAGQKLLFYALYKQATEGCCSRTRPGLMDFAGRAKWDAWNALKEITPHDAKIRYIHQLNLLRPDWEEYIDPALMKSKDSEKNNKSLVDSSGDEMDGSDWWKDEKRDQHENMDFTPAVSTLSSNQIEEQAWTNDEILFKLAVDNDVEKLRNLLKSGIDINAQDQDGRTALHYACDRGNLLVTELLVSHKALTDLKDNDGQTALHYAVECEHIDIAKILVKAGADIHAENTDQETPMLIASSEMKKIFLQID